MLKIANKFCYYLKNILLPILLVATIYIIGYMFQRLGKDMFGANLMEFMSVVLPFLLLMIILIFNTFLKHDNVRNCFFYNFTSLLVMIVIFIFCYRALFDQNMYMWHKYTYKINFNYFSDQLGPTKIMLYVLSVANILLIIEGYMKKDKKKEKVKLNSKKVLGTDE